MSPQNRKKKSALPADIETEGEFLKPLPIEGYSDPQRSWYAGLNPWQRLNSHYTDSSVRRNVCFKPFRLIKDHLDFSIRATYIHGREIFPEPVDVVLQPLTLNISHKNLGKNVTNANKNNPLIIGGIKEKVHPSYVKLMNSSHHSPLTNAGYVRQDRDGTMFYY